MTTLDDAELYRRGAETLIASWQAYAVGAPGAVVHRRPGAAVAVFPHEPERSVYNNALLTRDLSAAAATAALDALEETYATAGVERFAAWVHERDAPMRAELKRRSHRLDTATRAMGLAIDDFCWCWSGDLHFAPLDWSAYLRLFELPPGLLSAADHAAFHLLAAWVDAEPVAVALAFDHDGDCGIYNVGTVGHARRRGLATALTARQLYEARARGGRTASLQATAMAERVYRAVGFRDLGRFLEFVPQGSAASGLVSASRVVC
jgi:ribosomal protein S18 acetylase RimI-like enzyme